MKRIILILLTLFIIGLNLNAQTHNVTQKDSTTKRYINDEYNFSFDLPDDWVILEVANMKIAVENGMQLIKPNKKGLSEINKSVNLTENLINLSKSPLGTPGNAVLICAVEINQTPQATIQQSATATENSFVNNFGYTVVTASKKTLLGNKAFMVIKIKKKVTSEIELFQTIYIRKIGNKVLQFVLTFTQSADSDIMEKALKTLKFSK